MGRRLIHGKLFPGTLHDRPSNVLELLARPVERLLGFRAVGFEAREVGLGLAADGAQVGVDLAGARDGTDRGEAGEG